MIPRDQFVVYLFLVVFLLILLLALSVSALFRSGTFSVGAAVDSLSVSPLNTRSFLSARAPGDNAAETPEPEPTPAAADGDGVVAGETTAAASVEPQPVFRLDYPPVRVSPGLGVFTSPVAEAGFLLSEEEIQVRCSHFSIAPNRERCLYAERQCARILTDSPEHLRCLANERQLGTQFPPGR